MSARAGTSSCDLLLTNATILTMNESLEVFPRGAIAVTGDSIVAVGDHLTSGRPGSGSTATDGSSCPAS